MSSLSRGIAEPGDFAREVRDALQKSRDRRLHGGTVNQWTKRDGEYQSLLDKVVGLAQRYGYTLNPDKERVAKVVGLMTENFVASGKMFCPCKQSHPLDPTKDVTCPCPEWKADIEGEGHCFCRLFYKSPTT